MKRLTVLLLLLPALASADPGTATQYLMNEPASLMDIGLLKLNMKLEKLKPHLWGPFLGDGDADRTKVSASYDFAADEIRVQITFFSDAESIEDACKATIGALRVLLYDLVEFRHSGYVRDGQPDKLFTELEHRFQLICTVKDTVLEFDRLEAKGAWSDTRIYISSEE